MDFPLQAWAKSSLSTHLVNCKACTNASFNIFPNIVMSTSWINYIQLFRERLSKKVGATIPKDIVGGFKFTVL